MSKFIVFTNGILSARYISEIHGDAIPKEAVPVDDETFERTIQETDGIWSLVSGKVVKKPFPAKTLDELKAEKSIEIRTAYDAEALEPVPALGFDWDGGFESAIKLDAAMRLAQAAGALGVRFYDIQNVSHDLNFDQALQVCLAVAGSFQATLGKKQTLFNAIDKATTKSQVEGISW